MASSGQDFQSRLNTLRQNFDAWQKKADECSKKLSKWGEKVVTAKADNLVLQERLNRERLSTIPSAPSMPRSRWPFLSYRLYPEDLLVFKEELDQSLAKTRDRSQTKINEQLRMYIQVFNEGIKYSSTSSKSYEKKDTAPKGRCFGMGLFRSALKFCYLEEYYVKLREIILNATPEDVLVKRGKLVGSYFLNVSEGQDHQKEIERILETKYVSEPIRNVSFTRDELKKKLTEIVNDNQLIIFVGKNREIVKDDKGEKKYGHAVFLNSQDQCHYFFDSNSRTADEQSVEIDHLITHLWFGLVTRFPSVDHINLPLDIHILHRPPASLKFRNSTTLATMPPTQRTVSTRLLQSL